MFILFLFMGGGWIIKLKASFKATKSLWNNFTQSNFYINILYMNRMKQSLNQSLLNLCFNFISQLQL